ncbi:MAG TPA: penicillin-binding protein activator LpoB [Spirochaetota bacterium]|nr:penicillin-binding protein activator LpoB [Spirochaetota bacterium]
MKKFLVAALLLFMVGCGGGTQYQDVNKAEGSVEWGPKEIKITVDKMVTSLYSFLKTEWNKPAYLQVKKFQNRTSEHIDTDLIVSEIQTRLIQKRIKFIDDSLEADALKEMEKGMTGMVDPESAIPVGNLISPNLYLTGDIRENVRYVDGRKVQYLKVTLKLINIKTNQTEWQDQQEFLKSSKTDKISF